MALERWSERIWIDRLPAEPALADELTLLHGLVEDRDPAPDLVLDLSRVDIIHSTNISRLLRLLKLVQRHGARMHIVGPSDGVWTTFLASGLDGQFEFTTDITTSLAQLQTT